LDCVFCAIARGELPTKLVYETPDVVAFEDLNPQAPTHILIIPRRHYASLQDVPAAEIGILPALVAAAQELAVERRIWPEGYRLVVNTGPAGGQTVPHLHLHLLGGRQVVWPPG